MTKTIASLPNKQRVTSCFNVFVFCLFGLLVEGCATPVGIDPVNIQTSYQLNTQNALSAGQPSEATKTVLRRNGLMDRFENEPETVLAELKPMDDEDKLFALAELSLLHAQKTDDHTYFLAAAVYAWSLLFPDDDHGVQLKASDPRYRLAYDLYNQWLAQGLAKPEDSEEKKLKFN